RYPPHRGARGGGGARGARGAVPPRAGAPGGGVGRHRRRVPPPAGTELVHRRRTGGAGRRCRGRGARAAVRRVGRQERGCCRQPRRAELVRVDGAHRGRSAPSAARAAAARSPPPRRVLVRLAVATAAVLLPDFAALLAPYGLLLGAKLMLFAALMGLAALNRLRLTPALARGEPGALPRLRGSLAAEYVLICAVLTVTAVLTGFFSPAQTERDARAGTPATARA